MSPNCPPEHVNFKPNSVKHLYVFKSPPPCFEKNCACCENPFDFALIPDQVLCSVSERFPLLIWILFIEFVPKPNGSTLVRMKCEIDAKFDPYTLTNLFLL